MIKKMDLELKKHKNMNIKDYGIMIKNLDKEKYNILKIK